jgi:hypothetical protein
MTYLELQTEVRENVIDLPTVVTSRVPTLINRALHKLQTKHNFKVMDAEATFTTVASTRSIGSKPSDWKEWRLDPYWLSNNAQWQAMKWAPNVRSIRQLWQSNDDVGYPLYLLESDPTTGLGAETISVFPLPDGISDYDDGEYRLYVPYVKYLPDLSANGDTNWFTVNAQEYLINLATSFAFLADWDENRMGIWAQLAQNEYNDVLQRDKKARLSLTDTWVPYQDVNSPRIGN